MISKFKFIRIAVFVCMVFLTACAGSSKQEDSGVQDIQPGDQSVIQPPSRQAPVDNERQIEERNI